MLPFGLVGYWYIGSGVVVPTLGVVLVPPVVGFVVLVVGLVAVPPVTGFVAVPPGVGLTTLVTLFPPVNLSITALVPAPITAPVAPPVRTSDKVLLPEGVVLVTVGNLLVPVPVPVTEVVLVAGVDTAGLVTDVKGLDVKVPALVLPVITELGFAVVVVAFFVKDAGVVLLPKVDIAVLVVGVLVVEIGLEPLLTLVIFEVPTKEDAGLAPVPKRGLSTVPRVTLVIPRA